MSCNAVELVRMRQELMMSISEVKVLQDLYTRQVNLCNMASLKATYSESLTFDPGFLEKDMINYVDHGPASMLEIELAISELDEDMKSNLNFRSPDAFKILLTRSGLEELRTVLHYQMMQKQALIVACRCNQIVLDTHQRALVELEITKQGNSLPNMNFSLNQLFTRNSDGIDTSCFGKIRSMFKTNLSN